MSKKLDKPIVMCYTRDSSSGVSRDKDTATPQRGGVFYWRKICAGAVIAGDYVVRSLSGQQIGFRILRRGYGHG